MGVYRTADGVEITPGLRVYTIDCVWGTVEAAQFTPGGRTDPGGDCFDGFFKVEVGTGDIRLYDGSRMSTRKLI